MSGINPLIYAISMGLVIAMASDERSPSVVHRVENAAFEKYFASLVESYRPPSRGGNTRAWHSHSIIIGGQRYGFLALGARKWAYVGDKISFAWQWSKDGKYRNIDPDTFRAIDKSGQPVQLGHRGTKKWRTAPTKFPGSRREQRD